MANDIYQEVTDRIVGALEKGVAPWVRPWNQSFSGFPRNGSTKRPYSGMNVILCQLTALERGYGSQDWFTYKQAAAVGGNVRKGEKGTALIFWKLLEDKKDPDRKIPLLRSFYVFNREQIDGLPPSSEETVERKEGVEWADGMFREKGMALGHGGGSAFYSPQMDRVQMPFLSDFTDEGAYLSTLFHEATHWTGPAHRCDRDLSGRFGSESYAFEELVAEIGSAFLCAKFGVHGRLQHPEYIGSWIKKLKGDKKFIFAAARKAKEALDFLDDEELQEVA